MLLLISMANTIHGRSRQFSICAATAHSYLLGRRPKLPVGCVDSAWPSEVTQRQRLEWNPAASVRGSAGGTLWILGETRHVSGTQMYVQAKHPNT